MHGFLLLLCLFSDSFAVSVSFILNIDHGLFLRACCVFTFIYSIYLVVSTRNEIAAPKTMTIFFASFFIAVCVLISMFFTELKYGYTHKFFDSLVLSFGSKALVAPFFALAWNKHDFNESVKKWIPPFVVLLTLSMLFSIARMGNNSFQDLEIGYQLLSYTASFSIGLLFVFINSLAPNNFFNLIHKILAVILVLLNLFVLINGGGKGALVVVIVLFLCAFGKNLNIKWLLIAFSIILFFSLNFSSILNKLSMFSGGGRLISMLMSNDVSQVTSGRNYIYNNAVNLLFDHYFLGNGTGSVLYDLDYFAHNMFLDILLDWGFVGFLFCAGIFFVVIKKSLLHLNDKKAFFLFTIFLMSFVKLMFSGSFYENFGIWFSTIAILGYENERPKGTS